MRVGVDLMDASSRLLFGLVDCINNPRDWPKGDRSAEKVLEEASRYRGRRGVAGSRSFFAQAAMPAMAAV